ncbi:MAG: hypothetical protein JO234_06955 [Hyphomicrobiales bacterium]|nr:hypothetical protein [Hyphomicrobiales bacterium]
MSLVAERWATSLPETAFDAFETSGRGAGASHCATDLAASGGGHAGANLIELVANAQRGTSAQIGR